MRRWSELARGSPIGGRAIRDEEALRIRRVTASHRQPRQLTRKDEHTELDLEVARWLVTDDGLAAIRQVTRSLDDGADELAVLTERRGHAEDPARTRAVVSAAAARRRARRRWPDADRLVFTRESLEQASDPDVSRWRAARFVGSEVIDLCCGVGGDAIALARVGARVTAVDLDPARLILLAHNAACADVEVVAVAGEALAVPIPSGALVHADPARRRSGRRIRRLTDHVPPVDALFAAHGGARGMAVVLGPGVDRDDPALPGDIEVEYLQLGPDLVEAVVTTGALRRPGAVATATLLPAGVQLTRTGPRPAKLAVAPIGDLLVEVAPAAIRARLHDDIGGSVGARRLALRRALLSCSDRPPASPWYTVRQVVTLLAARPKAVRRWLRTADVGPLELVLHGVDLDPEAWWRELGRPPRGPGGARIELVRRDQDTVAVITRPVDPDPTV